MKINIPKFVKTTVAALAVSGLAIAAHADTTAVTISGTGTANIYGASSTPAGTGLVGIQFTLNQNINLTALGFYAQSIGADHPHVAVLDITGGQSNPPVVLYDTGDLTTQGLLNNATMQYFSLATPLLLTTGKTYEISAPIYFAEQFGQSGVIGSGTAGFSYGGALATVSFLQGGGWNGWDQTNGVPTQVYDYTAQTAQTSSVNVSSDFMYTLAIPEPSTYVLMGLGGFGLLFMRRRKLA